MSGVAANTDRELFREDTGDPAGSYYEDSVFVSKEGFIGMNVGGRVMVARIKDWHAALRLADELPEGFTAERIAEYDALVEKYRLGLQSVSATVEEALRG